MNIIEIIPGVKILEDTNFSILFGIPPEIIKYLINKNIKFPDYLVIPDKLHHNGILQNCTEFPLYYFLFVLGNYFKNKKLNILGNKKDIENNKELLRLTLLGPTKEEWKEIGENQYSSELYNESRFLSVKDKDGNEVTIEGFINFLHFENNEIITDYFTIKHISYNVYQVNDTIIDINFNENQCPPYEIDITYVPMIPNKFGVDILGGGSGFTPNKPTSCTLLNYHSDFMLLDCLPFLDYHLNARGISKRQIKSIFLTHIHDDHCNIFPLILFQDKIKFLATKEIYWMAIKKLSLMTNHNFSEFHSYFDFIELTPYKENIFYGIKIIPHYTVHSIPTIGGTFIMNDRDKEYSIVLGGDNKSLPEIKKMVDMGITSQEKYLYLCNLYKNKYNLFLADGGMGLLHGNPEDSLESKSDRVIFLHLEKLPEKFDATFSIAISGKRYYLIEGKYDSFLIKAMQIFNNYFPGISNEWLSTLMNNMNIIMLNSGDIIMKQGEERKGYIYIILSGTCSVVFHDGKKLNEIAIKDTGEFIGDMAIVKNELYRSASVIAKTPVILGAIDENLFLHFLKNENRIEHTIKIWDLRKLIEKIYPFSELYDSINESIIKQSEIIITKPNDVIIKQGEYTNELYIILDGIFNVYKNNNFIIKLKEGDLFGEFGALLEKVRNATIISETQGKLLKIKSNSIKEIIHKTPILNFLMNQIIKERSENI